MKKLLVSATILLTFLLLFVSCAPALPQTPIPISIPSATVAPTIISNPVSYEDMVWTKVVENAKKEGEVTVYSYDYFGDVGLALSAAFKNRYGIKMNIITGRSNDFIERIRTEKRLGQIVADYAEAAAASSINLKMSGLTKAVPDLPVLREKGVWELDPLVMDPEAHLLAPLRTVWSPWVNTKLVKPGQEPTSYYDLLKPEWKGKVVALDPRTVPSMYTFFVPLVNAKVLDWDYVKALGRQEMGLQIGALENAQSLARGDYPFSLLNTDNIAVSFVADGAPIKATAYKEGIVESVVPISVIAGGPHPNAAKVLANWILSEEGQWTYAKVKGATMVRKGVPDSKPINAQVPAGTKRVITTAKDIDDSARFTRERFMETLWAK